MLTMDEMYICESIIYDKHTGQIMEHGRYNKSSETVPKNIILYVYIFPFPYLNSLENDQGAFDMVAKTMLVFRVRGLHWLAVSICLVHL